MKKVLFASTAFAALAVGGAAFAQGITLYGSARLGLYYNDDADNKLQTTSRTRFGVTMTGETDSGITFGADMRADQVVDGSIDAADNRPAIVRRYWRIRNTRAAMPGSQPPSSQLPLAHW